MKTRTQIGNTVLWMNSWAALAMVFGLCISENQTAGAIEVILGQRYQFAGATCNLQLKVPARTAGETIKWRLMAMERTLSSGKSILRLISDTDDNQTVCSFDFQTPELNAGISIDARLIFDLDESRKSYVSLVIQHADPFANLDLGQRRIAVIDPDGSMKADLEKTSIVVQCVARLSGVQEEECIIIGEGVRWEPQVARAISAWMDMGRHVIVLRSEVGSAVPVEWPNSSFTKIEFSQLSGSRWAEPRLDPDYWPSTKRSAGWSVSLSPTALELTPVSAVRRQEKIEPQLWQLVEIQSKNGGVCLFIGVPVMKTWNQSPAPRELLKHILSETNRSQNSTQKHK